MALFHRLNGVLSVYKPSGMGSTTVVRKLEKVLKDVLLEDSASVAILKGKGVEKRRFRIGHGGTLDPLAEGVLIIGIGTGTKKLSTFLDCTKEYRATAKLGASTTTYDTEGDVVEKMATSHISGNDITRTFSKFCGSILQIPPIYSALKMDGKPLYDYARKNKELPREIAARRVTVHSLQLLDFRRDENAAEFDINVVVSKGTYIRTLVHDIGKELGNAAHLTKLERTRQGEFTVSTTLKEKDWNAKQMLEMLAK